MCALCCCVCRWIEQVLVLCTSTWLLRDSWLRLPAPVVYQRTDKQWLWVWLGVWLDRPTAGELSHTFSLHSFCWNLFHSVSCSMGSMSVGVYNIFHETVHFVLSIASLYKEPIFLLLSSLEGKGKGKGKGRCIALKERTPHRATEHHLWYGITQCYLPPDRGKRTPP